MSESRTATVKAETKTWFEVGEPAVAEFAVDTVVQVVKMNDAGWWITTAPVSGFPALRRILLREEHFKKEQTE